MLTHLGLQVNRLIRVEFGPFGLGELPEGAIEEVETQNLRKQLGDSLIAQAGCDFSGPVTERSAVAPDEPKLRGARGQGRQDRPDRRPSERGTTATGHANAPSDPPPRAIAMTASRNANPAAIRKSIRKSRPAGRGAAMPGARRMHRCGAPIGAPGAKTSRSRPRSGPTSAPAC